MFSVIPENLIYSLQSKFYVIRLIKTHLVAVLHSGEQRLHSPITVRYDIFQYDSTSECSLILWVTDTET